MLERILDISIRHRLAVLVLTVAVAVLGAASLSRLPIDAVPDITNNQVQINTVHAALSPAEIETQVTFPVETSLAGIPGLQYTRSLSRNGFSQVTAVFADDVDIYFARNQVNERLSEARENLPPGAEPRMGPIATGLGEVFMYTVEYEHPGGVGAPVAAGRPGWQPDSSYLTPEGESLRSGVELAGYLRTVQDWVIRPQLRTVKDVAGVDSIGGFVKQFHVQPDPMKLVSYGLGFSDLIEALERGNISTGAGFIEHLGEAYVVRAYGRIESIGEIENIVISTRDDVPIHIDEVAEVVIGPELRTGTASENGEEVVVGTALMLIGANSRTVAASVELKMQQINRSLPPGIRAKTVLNRTKLVNATIETVAKNLIEGALLVIVVLFLMLGNIRAALITAMVIPLSMLMTATGMVSKGVTGNLMSLGALDFGIIVDGAVIIVENCLRRLGAEQHRLGRLLTLSERLETVRDATQQVRRPSLFGEAIIMIVYLPILGLAGVEGKMFHPMALTVIFALAAAFLLSMTFVPAMVALLISGRVSEKENIAVRTAIRAYEPVLRAALRHRWHTVGAAVLIFAGSAALFSSLGQEFVPTLDEKDVAMQAIRIPSTGVTQSTAMQADVERIVSRFPEVAFVFSKTGTAEMASDPMPPNISDTFIILKPQDEWPDPAESKSSLLERIEEAVEVLPGNAFEFTQPIQMRFNELIAGVRGDVAVKVFGDDYEGMQDTAQAIAAVMSSLPGASAVRVEQTAGLPVVEIKADRAALARVGLSVAEVQDVVSIALGGRQAGLVFQGDRRFDLVVRLPETQRADVHDLGNLPIPVPRRDDPAWEHAPFDSDAGKTSEAGYVPLGSVMSIEITEGPNQISRENGKRRVVVQANVRNRDLGSFVSEAQAAIGALPLPAGSWLEWGGQFENLVAARERLTVIVPLCFVLIFGLLFITLRSARQSLLVFSGVPLAMTGGVGALWLRDIPFSITSAVGFIALSGVAVLNGLVLVSFINELRTRGETVRAAIVQGALTRLRPVLMTALVASLGFVPMALATGTGAEVQRPLATVVIGGLISSTILTLVVLPALYLIFEGTKADKRDSAARTVTAPEPA